MKGNILKWAVALILSAAITIFPFSPYILALDGDNSGTGEWSGIEGGSSTWDIDHQGYRICIVNESGSPVSNAVDVLYSNNHTMPTSNIAVYNTTRTGGTSSFTCYWTDIGFSSNSVTSNNPPAALIWSGGPIGNGTAVSEWFGVEANAHKVINAKRNASYIFTFNSSSAQNLITEGKTVVEVMQEKGYLLTVEPITWFKPCNTDNSLTYPKYIYGTIYNICKWYYDNNALVNTNLGGGIRGGYYGNVIHCLWTSMYIESNIIGLTGSSSASTFTAYDSSTLAEMYSAMQTLGAGIHVYRLGNGANGTITAVIWYGTETNGVWSWSYTTETADAAKVVSLNSTVNKSYNGHTYQQYALSRSGDASSGTFSLSSESMLTNTAVFTVSPAGGSSSGPVSYLNNLRTASGSNKNRYVYNAYITNDVKDLLESGDLKAVHFVFCYSQKAAENVLYYPKGTKVITAVTLYNNTGSGFCYYNLGYYYGTDVREDSRASVSFVGKEGSYTWSKSVTQITAAAGTTQLVWIEWTTPTDRDQMTLVATPNKGSLLHEGNPVTGITFTVYLTEPLKENTPPDPKANDSSNGYSNSTKNSYFNSITSGNPSPEHTWTKQDSTSVLKVETDYLIYYYDDGSYSTGWSPISGKEVTSVSYHYKASANTKYYTKKYTVKVDSVSASIKPSVYCPTSWVQGGTTYMKSGYGIYTEVTATLKATEEVYSYTYNGSSWVQSSTPTKTTATVKIGNSYGGYAVGFQAAESYFPEFYYSASARGTYNRVLRIDTANRIFTFAANPYSPLNDKAHYTPLWYPDNADYRTITNIYYAYTPVGVVTVKGTGSNIIRINGNVYDDWHVAVVG